MSEIFPAWTAQTSAQWGRAPLRVGHSLDTHPAFSRAALADLIDRFPREHYSLIHMGARGENRRLWREGEIGGLSGEKVLNAIETGRMWLNLRNVSTVERRYHDILEEICASFGARVPGFEALRRNCGILISSPSAQVYYHADLPAQALFQIAGAKRVFLYPKTAPYITARDLADIALFDVEVDLPYDASYESGAQAFDLTPGQMLTWPLNAPHRVENVTGMNVSMTLSWTSRAVARAGQVHLANGILRHRFGIPADGMAVTGASYWTKAVLQKMLRNQRWISDARAARRACAFRLAEQTRDGAMDLSRAA